MTQRPTRRSVLGTGVALAGGAGAGLVGYGLGVARGGDQPAAATSGSSAGAAGSPASSTAGTEPTWATQVEPFHGARQSGILTPPQAFGTFLALDLAPTGAASGDTGAARDALRRLLRQWSTDASRLQRGIPALGDTQPDLASPPSRLTVTVGIGRGALTKAALLDRAPTWLAPLPAFAVDRLQARWGEADVLAQVCAEDPIVLAHAVRVLLLDASGIATVRWMQRGFRRPATSASAMRNLMGQVDGTVQPTEAEVGDLVWIGDEGPVWLRGGSSLVVRRIAMNLDTWDSLDPVAKEQVIGRRLASGAPLTGTKESDKPDLEATSGGLKVIPDFAHIRHAAPVGAREKILRRPYNYDETPPGTGDSPTADAGLLFACYQRDPLVQFVPIQQRLDRADLLNVWTTPIGSAVFAVLPGVTAEAAAAGAYLGQALVEG